MKTTLPTDSAERKRFPIFRGPLRYFPAALAAVSEVCRIGNEKHNPGEEMHHARGKSNDHADCIVRHLVDLGENGGLDENGVPQVAYIAWRALALAQEWLEANTCAPLAPGARLPEAEAEADPLQGWTPDPDDVTLQALLPRPLVCPVGGPECSDCRKMKTCDVGAGCLVCSYLRNKGHAAGAMPQLPPDPPNRTI